MLVMEDIIMEVIILKINMYKIYHKFLMECMWLLTSKYIKDEDEDEMMVNDENDGM